jgi:acetoin utilization protein AcuB
MTPTEANVAAVMTEAPIVIAPNEPLALAARTMARHGVRHLPVVDGGALVGLVSQRDLLAARGADKLVRDVMAAELAVTHPGASACEAARALLTLRIGCLPVLDDGALVGIVTETDFVRVAYAVLAAVSASSQRATPVRARVVPDKKKQRRAGRRRRRA